MSERIEWSDTETRNYRCWLRVVRCWEVTPGRIEGQVEGQATVEDLRRACEAAGLTLATAQHAEDLEKLGKEMAEVVAQRDAAREYVDRAREMLGAVFMEPLTVAARRVVAERDEAIARAEKAEALHAEAEGQIACRNELRARIEAASPPAPQGQPVATDEDLFALYMNERTEALSDPDRTALEAHRIAVAAIARHVRAERPACLVARAVALGCDVRVIAGDMRCGVHVKGGKIDIMASTRTADVPATLARLLDEVEAARKGGAK